MSRTAKPVARYAVIAPISKNPRKPGHIFYREQQERNKRGLGWCWNDSTNNSAKVGDLFAFYFHGKKVVFHEIISIRPPSERLPTWSNEERNVLILSEPLFKYNWDWWCIMGSPQCNRKTYRTNLTNWTYLYDNLYGDLDGELDYILDGIKRPIKNLKVNPKSENPVKLKTVEVKTEEESLVILKTTATEITDSLRALDFKISTILL
jgi:hypothetical protein